ncbi:MAG: twin-arginine translocation signal domain-containing protein, partial [Bacteroidia bacterium]|nr:twin-arginine translocation signal domain-containing protein [Bacteroidia bacterium]
MSRRKFLKQSLTVAAATTTGFAWAQQKKVGEYYELRIYEVRNKGLMDEYLSKAFIPALNRAGVKAVGAFTELGKAEPIKLYVLIAYPSLAAVEEIQQKVIDDKAYAEASKNYDAVPADSPVYWRCSTSFMKAFEDFPQMVVP